MVLDVTLKQANENDYDFLFNLLKERDPKANISHKQMPSYDEHVKFISSNPYTVWYIVYFEGKKVGSIYLSKQDEIGIFLKRDYMGKKVGSQAIKILMKQNPRKRFLANIGPKNEESLEFFKKHKFQLIQYTYEFISES